jgi:hypothetical protein
LVGARQGGGQIGGADRFDQRAQARVALGGLDDVDRLRLRIVAAAGGQQRDGRAGDGESE